MKEHTFLINLWIDPTFYYEELHDCISKLWKEVFYLFTNFEMIRNQRSFNISIDWGELKKVISHNLKYNISLEQYSKMDENTKAFITNK